MLTTSIRGTELEGYTLKCYTAQTFKAAYAENVPAMTWKMWWVTIDTEFKIHHSVIRRTLS